MSKSGGLFRVDWYLIAPVLVLSILGLTTLFSINSTFFTSQLIFFIIGSVLFLFFSQVDHQIIQLYAFPIYIFSLIALFLLLILGLESRGAIRWIDILGIRIQFSEILKPFLIVSLSTFLAKKNDTSFKTFLSVIAFTLPVAFFIFRQPDLGNTIIYLLTVSLILLFYGFPFRWFVVGLMSFLVVIPFAWHLLHQYQQQRILTFFNSSKDPLGTSYNAIQSVIAVGSGKFFGKGLGFGTQSALRFLPERHTDFIFATLSEMLGFVGALVIIGAFMYLLYRLFILFEESDDLFCRIFIAGSFSLILTQFFLNMGMNIGLLPIVGITLPFMSYGGSSFISNAIMLGLISSMASLVKNKHVLEIK